MPNTMLSKVAQRVRRGSNVKPIKINVDVDFDGDLGLTLTKTTTRTPMTPGPPITPAMATSPTITQRKKVDCAPDLYRWSYTAADLETPFPSVTFGGYLKYYKSLEDCDYDPPTYALSKFSLSIPSSGSASPEYEKSSPTFLERSARTVPPQIHTRTRHLSISSPPLSPVSPNTNFSLNTRSLRRKRATYLRAPSIERDFADQMGRLFNSALSNTTSNSNSSSIQAQAQVYKDALGSEGEGGKKGAEIRVEEVLMNSPGSPVDDTPLPQPIQRSDSIQTSTTSDSHSTSSVSDLFEVAHRFTRGRDYEDADDADDEEEDDDDEPVSPASSVGEDPDLSGVSAGVGFGAPSDISKVENIAKIPTPTPVDSQLPSHRTIKIDIPPPPTHAPTPPPTSTSPPPIPKRSPLRPESRLSFVTAVSEFSDRAAL